MEFVIGSGSVFLRLFSTICVLLAPVPLPIWHLTSLDVVKKLEMQKLRKCCALTIVFLLSAPPVILVRLKQDYVELWEELKGKGDIGRQRKTYASGNHLGIIKHQYN